MDLGPQEIIVIIVIILVLFVGVKVFADKRYLKRPGTNKNKTSSTQD